MMHDTWGARWLDWSRQDLAYALRQVRRAPRFAALVVVIVALGIGANSAIFTVAHAVLFRDLPYREPQRLVQIWNTFRQHAMENVVFSHLEYLDYRARLRGLEDIAVYGQDSQTLTSSGEPEQIWVSTASTNLFELLGARPLHGRTFAPEESEPGRGAVVMLSHGLWQRRFGADPAVVGTSIQLDARPYLIVGVMSPAFRSIPTLAEAWRPIIFSGPLLDETQRGSRSLWMIGRLKPVTSLDEARREMDAHARQLAAEHPAQYPPELGHAVTIVPLHEEVTGRVRPALLVLLGAVGMVLLIACANVANLLLARGTDRRRELGIRAALGASRARLLAQLVTESLVLAILGGAAGVLLAVWSVDLLMQWMPSGVLPREHEVTVSGAVLWFTLGLTLLTGVAFGLAPAWQGASLNLAETVKAGARNTEEPHRKALRDLLTVTEVALALILLAAAGLLMRSFGRLLSVPPGFVADEVLTARIALPSVRYPTHVEQLAFFQQLSERARRLPGVDAVGLVTSLPFSGWRNDWTITPDGVPGMDGRGGSALPLANYFAVNAGYFRSMGIPLVKGRVFQPSDVAGPPVVIVNKTLADRFWQGQDPIGRRLKMGGPDSPWPWRTIVGVAGDVRQTNLETAVMPEIFVFNEDARKPAAPSMFLVARTRMDAVNPAAAIRREVASLDPAQAVTSIRSLSERVSLSVAERRFHLLLLAVFAGLALMLAAVGVYGVMAYVVGQRTREVGVRLALGAQRHDVFRLVIGQGMRLAGIGVAVGLACAAGLTRYLESLLFEIEPTDPVTLAAVAGLLTIAALLACWLPARRASSVDPIVALKDE
jgi:putative ABC transport system permease protein